MANVVNKANPSLFLRSVNTPEYDPAEWLINPASFGSLAGVVPSRYWKLSAGGDDIEEMSQAEKDAVDAAEAAAQLEAQKTAAKSKYDSGDEASRVDRAIAKLTVDEINLLRQRINAIEAAIEDNGSLNAIKSALLSLPSMPDRTYDQARSAIQNLIDGE